MSVCKTCGMETEGYVCTICNADDIADPDTHEHSESVEAVCTGCGNAESLCNCETHGGGTMPTES